MHLRTTTIIIMGLFISACSSGQPAGSQGEIPFVGSALRFELSFGDDGLPEEFLLAEPKGLAIKDSGDILVTDEYHIKIYDAEGTPQERLGGQGQGPGEFQESQQALVGPTGFLTIGNGFSQFNLYGPDLTYISRYNGSADEDLRNYISEQSLTFNTMTDLCLLDESRRIYALFGRNRDLPGKFPVFNYLVYHDGNSLEELVKHHSRAYVLNNRGGSTSSPYLGDFHWGVLTKNRIVHAQTHQGNKDNGPGSSYALNILDLNGGSDAVIEVEYDPAVLPDSLRELKTQHFREINLTIEPPPALQALLNEIRLFPAFQAMRTDSDLVFLFKFNPDNEELERSIEEAEMNGEEIPEGIYARFEPYQVDIVNVSSGRLVVQAEFSCIPDVIKNGRAYRLNKRADAFPKVECFLIDPAVYRSGKAPL
ncbi:MAG: hypothetical protein ACERK6_08780 [Candidatus Aminicenantaceae bacterium]